MRVIRVFFENIKRLFYWIPIIWKDRDYDQIFLFRIIYYKLLSMKKFYKSDKAMGMPADKNAKDINKALMVLNRIINDEYEDNAFICHDKKWGDIEFSTIKLPHKNYKLNMIRKNVITEEDEEKEKKEFHKCLEHSDKQRKQDLDYLFKIMKKYVFEWWD